MTDLTTTNLKRLLDQTTTGPWNVHTRDRHFDGETETWLYVGDTPALSVDYQLMSAAPELAQEVIRLRTGVERLLEMCLLERDTALHDSPMRAGEVAAFNLCAERLTELLTAANHTEEE